MIESIKITENNDFNANLEYLEDLITTPGNENIFIANSSRVDRKRIRETSDELIKTMYPDSKSEIEQKTIDILFPNKGITLQEAKKNRGWGKEFIKQQDLFYEEKRKEILELVNLYKNNKDNPEYNQEMKKKFETILILLDSVEKKESLVRDCINKIYSEINFIEDNTDQNLSNNFKEALSVWGRTRNSKNDPGANNLGYNAGLVHCFEYYLDEEKSGRYINGLGTIQDFIEISIKLKSYIQNPNPETNRSIKRSVIIEDQSGAQRRIILTNEGEMILAHKKSTDTEFKIITSIPGQTEKDVEKMITEPKEKREGKFNALVGDIKIIENKSQ